MDTTISASGSSTLNSDRRPTWQPGAVEKFFYGDTQGSPNPVGKHTPASPVSNSGASPATAAFQSDAVYSLTGASGNFPIAAAAAITPSPAAFTAAAPTFGSDGLAPFDPAAPGPPQAGPMLGIFSGQPILPLPHQFWRRPDKSSASRNGALSDFLAGLARRNPVEFPPDDDPREFDSDGRAQGWFVQRQR